MKDAMIRCDLGATATPLGQRVYEFLLGCLLRYLLTVKGVGLSETLTIVRGRVGWLVDGM